MLKIQQKSKQNLNFYIMNKYYKISIALVLSLIFNFGCLEEKNVQPSTSIDIEKLYVPVDDGDCPNNFTWHPYLRECVPDPFIEVDNELYAMGAQQVVTTIKSKYISIGNQSDIFIALTCAKNNGTINLVQYSHATNLLDDIFDATNPTEINSTVVNFKSSLSGLGLSTLDRERLFTFANVVEGIINDIESDPENTGLSPEGIREKIFCS